MSKIGWMLILFSVSSLSHVPLPCALNALLVLVCRSDVPGVYYVVGPTRHALQAMLASLGGEDDGFSTGVGDGQTPASSGEAREDGMLTLYILAVHSSAAPYFAMGVTSNFSLTSFMVASPPFFGKENI